MTRNRFLKSPLLHFFLLGGLIFVGYAIQDDSPDEAPDTITMNMEEARQLADKYTGIWNREPTPEEMNELMERWALDEASVREALALGLDRDDAVIRLRLNVKMQFLAESRAAGLTPEEVDLQAYMEENRDKFEIPARLAFRQVSVPDSTEARVVEIRASLNAGDDPRTLGEASLLPQQLDLSTASAIDRTFGAGFAEKLAALPDGEWVGPVDSGYGRHLVLVTGRSAAELPPLDAIRDRVEAEWRASQARAMRESFEEGLRDRYRFVLPGADEVLSQ